MHADLMRQQRFDPALFHDGMAGDQELLARHHQAGWQVITDFDAGLEFRLLAQIGLDHFARLPGDHVTIHHGDFAAFLPVRAILKHAKRQRQKSGFDGTIEGA
ncbi:hypothetical protein D3C86_1713540 [compost metagenome]